MNQEFENKAKWAVSVISELGLAEAYLEGSEEQRAEIIEVAMIEIGKKIEKMQTKILTNGEAREAFGQVVLGVAS